MAHMVIFRTSEGKPAYHQTEGLDDAVRFVEHLRNQEQVTDARIFTLTEVPIEFKVHWRVEIASGEPEPQPEPEQAVPFEAAAEPVAEQPDVEQVPVSVGAGDELSSTEFATPDFSTPAGPSASSRFGLFNRG